MQIDMKRVDQSCNMDRFYSVQVIQDLLGDHCVSRHWGRRGTRGQSLMNSYKTEDEAEGAASKLIKQKLGRGYRLIFMLSKTEEQSK